MRSAALGFVTDSLLCELLAFHARFPSLFETSLEPKLLLDLDGALVCANAAACKLLGRPERVLRGKRFSRGLSRHMSDYELEAFTLAKNGHTARVATTIARPGGALLALEATLFAAIVDGRTVGVYVSALDVTSRMERERATNRRMQELSSFFEHHADCTVSIDAAGRIRAVNPAFEKRFGYDASELVGKPLGALLFDGGGSEADEMFRRALEGRTTTGSIAAKTRAGRRIDLTGVVIPIVVDGRAVGAYAVGNDGTQGRGETERIRELYLLAANAGQSAEAQLASAIDLGRRRLNCGEAYFAEVDRDELRYVHCTGVTRRREGARVRLAGSLDARAIGANEPIAVDGSRGHAAIVAPIAVGGQPYGTLAFVAPRSGAFSAEDIDYVRLIASLASAAIERGQQSRRLDALAFYDALTGLPNRVALANILGDTIATAAREQAAFAVQFFDLDGFKAINDEHGHACGDDVISLVGKRFERQVAAPNFVARIGGDEFVVVQPSARTRADASALAGTLRAAIAEPFVVDGREYRLSASVGIAFYAEDGASAAELLTRADVALYKVKATGRDAIAFAADV
jgi:diguanylate cyclase (GGDEF)-like protein/PAS domain S-box-containing protein